MLEKLLLATTITVVLNLLIQMGLPPATQANLSLKRFDLAHESRDVAVSQMIVRSLPDRQDVSP